jgi:hypothetical protein
VRLYPPLSSLGSGSFATATAAPPDPRPVIRPAVASPIAPASGTSSARRITPSAPGSLATGHLGIEESEFDKPTYLRRALAGEGIRNPGDGKG